MSKYVVKLSSKVTIEDSYKYRFTVTLVDSNKIDLSKSKISFSSPVGKALLGHKEKESIRVQTPQGNKVYKILAVE